MSKLGLELKSITIKLTTMKTMVLILGLWLLTGITGCTKESTSSWQSSDIKFFPEAKEYLNIPVNTNFTYKDAGTGDVYSVIVQSCSIKKVFQPGYLKIMEELNNEPTGIPDHYYEDYNMVMVSGPGDGNKLRIELSTIDPVAAYNGNYFNTIVTGSANLNLEGIWNGVAFCLPNTSISELIPECIVNGKAYHDVLKIGDGQSSFWWMKGVGIIKMVLINTQVNKTFLMVENGNEL